MNAIIEKPAPLMGRDVTGAPAAGAPAPPQPPVQIGTSQAGVSQAGVSQAGTSQTGAVQPDTGRRSRLKWLLAPAALLAVGAAAITAQWWFSEGRWIQTTDNAYVQGDIAVLSPRIDGDVIAIRVADNQLVHTGDALIELDPSDWKARLAQAQAALAEAKAQVTTYQAQLLQQRSTMNALAASRDLAAAEQDRAIRDAGRSQALVTRGWTSQQANELAVTTSRKAGAQVAVAAAQEAAARDQLAVIAAQLTQAEARRQGAEAQLTLARNNLDHTIIRAPFDGVVGNRAAQPGKHVSPGTQLLALAPLANALYVTANFKETQLRNIRPGQIVRLIPDIDPGAAIDAVVDSLPPASGALFSLLPPENATGNFTKVVQRFPVRLKPVQGAGETWLRAGLSVTAEVDTRGPHAVRLGWWGSAKAAIEATLGFGSRP